MTENIFSNTICYIELNSDLAVKYCSNIDTCLIAGNYSTNDSTAGVFPTGFVKGGNLIITPATGYTYEKYVDALGKRADRVYVNNAWRDWNIKISNSDLQSGIVTISNVPVGENEYTFNFADVFTSAPKAIIATIQKRGYSDKLHLQANIKNAAQFTMSVYNGAASAIDKISVYWIAK